uniref:CBS domain-containing protein n=1 Tax=Streptomyces phytophilus TaxID=722715 RepID=UPI001C691081
GPGEEVPVIGTLGPGDTLFDALDRMLSVNSAAVAVVDGDGRYRGVLEMDAIRELMNAAGPTRAPGSTVPEAQEVQSP